MLRGRLTIAGRIAAFDGRQSSSCELRGALMLFLALVKKLSSIASYGDQQN
jgi:hypothetical protein